MSRALSVAPGGPLRGRVRLPGDKSISHRGLLFGALGTGPTVLRNLLRAEDVAATRRVVEAWGVEVEDRGDEVWVHGTGALREPHQVIDCGNSGTTLRLSAGIAAGEGFLTVLTGDGSLRRRPMGRVVRPLSAMGARIEGRSGGEHAPLAIRGGRLSPIPHDLPIASAQVKSALMLATRREGARIREPGRSRDHTERLLQAMGARVELQDRWLTLAPVERLEGLAWTVPGDLSSAAFWLVAASVVPGSEIELPGVGVNPTRTGVLDVLLAMGADIDVLLDEHEGPEPTATLVVRSAPLRGVHISGGLALRALDELPVLSIAAAFAQGETTIEDAAELRVKESDRIARCAQGLRSLGVDVEERSDGMVIQGGRPRGPAEIDGRGDHRLVMAFAVAGAAGEGGVTVRSAEEVATSYPEFASTLASLGAHVEPR